MAVHDLAGCGGIGDGVHDNTAAFAEAARRCAVDGGGVLLVQTGTWLTGSVRLPSRTTLRIEAGATVLGSRDPDRYPLIARPWEGRITSCREALIAAEDAEDVVIAGDGVIDGQGEDWWRAVRAKTPEGLRRPLLISLRNCRRVRLAGLALRRSPAWTVHPWRCQDVRIDGVSITNPPDAPNTDGIDPESCRDVVITGCRIDVGDDAIVLKAGTSETGGGCHPPCERVAISACTIVRGHGGIVIGSEMSGGVRDVVVTGCVLDGTDRGIRIKTRRGRGGAVENLTVSAVTMRRVGCPLVVHAYYRYTGLQAADVPWVSSREPQPVDVRTPLIRGLHLTDVVADEVTGPCLGFLYGLPERPIAEVSLRGCRFRHRLEADPAQAEPAMMVHWRAADYPTCGLYAADVDGLTLADCRFEPRAGSALVTERTTRAG